MESKSSYPESSSRSSKLSKAEPDGDSYSSSKATMAEDKWEAKSTGSSSSSSKVSDSEAAPRSTSQLQRREDKIRALERELDEEVDAEFEALKLEPNVGTVLVAPHPKAREILSGFKINWMNMSDGQTGKVLWHSSKYDNDMFETEYQEDVPKEILQCRVVSREINFSAREEMRNFRIEQRVFFEGQCIEEWFFKFGYVIPGSTNTWQHSIEAAPEEKMLSADELSGKVTFETSFFDDDFLIGKALVRIFYV